MKTSKKNNLFFAFLIAGTTFNAFSMDKPEPKEKKSSFPKWVKSVGTFMLGEKKLKNNTEFDALSQLISDLPGDIKNLIFGFLKMGQYTDSLDIAAYNITQLAQVNKELNTLINDPQFCLKLIKNLSARFNCSNFIACSALQTKQAKHQLNIQNQLFELCKNEEAPEHLFALLCFQGADLLFTYDYKDQQATPLMIAATNASNAFFYLLKAGVDINHSINNGITTLMFVAHKQLTWATEFLVKNPNIAINQQDMNGNTALMHCLKNGIVLTLNTLYNLRLILEAGADPTITDNERLTPLNAAAKKTGNPEVINLIERAIHKWGKK